MIMIVLIAIAAGCASALMFASIISGALISLVLFYLAPLPLMVAALGWGPLSRHDRRHRSGHRPRRDLRLSLLHRLCPHDRAAGLVARASRAAGPARRRCRHRAMAPRRLPPDMEWYPIGRVLLWIAGFATLTTMAALLTLGTDAATITGALRRGLLRDHRSAQRGFGRRHPSNGSTRLMIIAPAAAAIVAMMTLTLNLWLAARITATSGRLRRPWPDLKSDRRCRR